MQADQIPPLQVLFDSEFSCGGIGRLILVVRRLHAMILHSEDGKTKLELVPCGAELAAYPSLCFSVSVATPDVSGGHGELWFELEAVEQFVRRIVALDQSRSGSVALESMSPGEFSFEVVVLNSRGHLGVRLGISGSRYAESTSFPYSLTAGFQIDPTSLPHIADALRADIQQQQANVA